MQEKDGWYADGFVEQIREMLYKKISLLLRNLEWAGGKRDPFSYLDSSLRHSLPRAKGPKPSRKEDEMHTLGKEEDLEDGSADEFEILE